MHQNRLMRRFRDAKATAPGFAKMLTEIGCRDSRTFRQMAAKDVFVETAGGRFYLNEDPARWFARRRWRIMIVFLVLVILLSLLWEMCP